VSRVSPLPISRAATQTPSPSIYRPPHRPVEKASHFFAVTPTVTHADVPSVMCNYGSWLKRGWCRLEMLSLLLSRFNENPVIVVKGAECQPCMISPNTVVARPPGGGELTWCVRWGLESTAWVVMCHVLLADDVAMTRRFRAAHKRRTVVMVVGARLV
jgi:hypothetical protein